MYTISALWLFIQSDSLPVPGGKIWREEAPHVGLYAQIHKQTCTHTHKEVLYYWHLWRLLSLGWPLPTRVLRKYPEMALRERESIVNFLYSSYLYLPSNFFSNVELNRDDPILSFRLKCFLPSFFFFLPCWYFSYNINSSSSSIHLSISARSMLLLLFPPFSPWMSSQTGPEVWDWRPARSFRAPSLIPGKHRLNLRLYRASKNGFEIGCVCKESPTCCYHRRCGRLRW